MNRDFTAFSSALTVAAVVDVTAAAADAAVILVVTIIIFKSSYQSIVSTFYLDAIKIDAKVLLNRQALEEIKPQRLIL